MVTRVVTRHVHRDHRSVSLYLRAYLAKRDGDTHEPPARDGRGRITYKLKVATPSIASIARVLPAYIACVENIRVHPGGFDVYATCDDTVTVSTTVRADAARGGSVVLCEVSANPYYKGCPVPHAIVRLVVKRVFHRERKRDTDWIDQIQKGGSSWDGGSASHMLHYLSPPTHRISNDETSSSPESVSLEAASTP